MGDHSCRLPIDGLQHSRLVKDVLDKIQELNTATARQPAAGARHEGHQNFFHWILLGWLNHKVRAGFPPCHSYAPIVVI